MSVKLAPFFREEYLLTYGFLVLGMINFLIMLINFFSLDNWTRIKNPLHHSVYRLDGSWWGIESSSSVLGNCCITSARIH